MIPVRMNEDVSPIQHPKDKPLDATLRPTSWDGYIGQDRIKDQLKIFIDAARKRNDALDHVLLYGPPGLGKTTLSHIIARECGVNIRITSGPAIENGGDLASILTNLAPNDVLFIDEIHRLNKSIEEILYPAMEQRALDIILGKGPSAKTIQIDLPPFTLIGATTKAGSISAPLRSRFGITNRLEFYDQEDIEKIIRRSASLLGSTIDEDAISFIASCSRSTPRVANRILRRTRDYADVKNNGIISRQIAGQALSVLEIDGLGLEPTDRQLLLSLIEKYNGGPVGLKTLADSITEEVETLEDIYEPYLMRIGFLDRTPRGRVATIAAYEHLNIELPL